MTDYKAGTVAKIHDPAYGELTAILVDRGPLCWHGMLDNGDFRCVLAREATDVRPLVTVDLADLGPRAVDYPGTLRELSSLASDNGLTGAACILRNLAEQIEAQTRDPKPAEPTGLGAVVEDAEGLCWVRVCNDDEPWVRDGGEIIDCLAWDEIDAVRILSDGVTA